MPKFYHLDRTNSLTEGQIIELKKINNIECSNNPLFTNILQNQFNRIFPNGVTKHGDGYFASGTDLIYTEPVIELLFEYVRKAEHNDKPSRGESFFGLESIGDALILANILNCDINQCTVWEVECDNYFKGDMNLLHILPSNLVTIYMANEYWSGKTATDLNPFWEYLLVPPVKVIRKIELI